VFVMKMYLTLKKCLMLHLQVNKNKIRNKKSMQILNENVYSNY